MPPYRSVRRSGYGRVPRGGGAVRNLARGMGYAWRNRRAIVKAGRSIGKSFRKWYSSANSASSRPVTANYDYQTTRPPKPKRVNRRFTKKVENVISQHEGKHTVLFTADHFSIVSQGSEQGYQTFALFGANGSVGHNRDMAKILSLYGDLAEEGTEISPEHKNIFFFYGVLELHFTNRNTASRCYVEIYEYKMKKGINITATSLTTLITGEEAEERVLEDQEAGTVLDINMTDLNATPYMLGAVSKYVTWGKKTTIQLAAGGTSKYVMARKKNKWISGDKIKEHESWAVPGWTEGVLFVVKGAPAATSLAATTTLDFSMSRKYSWRAMDPHAQNEYGRMVV